MSKPEIFSFPWQSPNSGWMRPACYRSPFLVPLPPLRTDRITLVPSLPINRLHSRYFVPNDCVAGGGLGSVSMTNGTTDPIAPRMLEMMRLWEVETGISWSVFYSGQTPLKRDIVVSQRVVFVIFVFIFLLLFLRFLQ